MEVTNFSFRILHHPHFSSCLFTLNSSLFTLLCSWSCFIEKRGVEKRNKVAFSSISVTWTLKYEDAVSVKENERMRKRKKEERTFDTFFLQANRVCWVTGWRCDTSKWLVSGKTTDWAGFAASARSFTFKFLVVDRTDNTGRHGWRRKRRCFTRWTGWKISTFTFWRRKVDVCPDAPSSNRLNRSEVSSKSVNRIFNHV